MSTLQEGYMGTEESIFSIMSYRNPFTYRRYALDSNGLVIESSTKNDPFFNLDVYYPYLLKELRLKNRIEKVAYNIFGNKSIEIDNASHNIPKVRAGPVLM